MSLNETPDEVQWPVTHYIYIEKIGPFHETARACWEALHKNTAEVAKKSVISGYMSLYRQIPEMIYRAGVVVDLKPDTVPPGMQYFKFEGGKYSRFIYKGGYAQLPEVSGRVFNLVDRLQIQKRDDFYIENYVNSPDTTPEENLTTEILIPTV